MHIAIEATQLLRDRRGIGRYTRNLMRELPVLRPDIRYSLHVNQMSDDGPLREQLASFGDVAARITCRPIAALRDSDADVAWYPWNRVEPLAVRPAVAVTIHDLIPMLQLDGRWWKVLKRFKHRRRYQFSVSHADVVLADSTFTAQEIGRRLVAGQTEIRVVLLAANDFDGNTDSEASVLATLGVDGPFFMTVGAHEGRKNLPVLLSAMQELQRRGRVVPLVLCGPGNRLSRAADKSATAASASRWLRYAGFVSDAELAAMYRRATALVFPSRYEGFGLPVLEAMAAGGRVVCANASSLPEVAGNAALLFAPDDVQALANHLEHLLLDDRLRAELTQRGQQQAAKFSWQETARQSLAAFDWAITRKRASRT